MTRFALLASIALGAGSLALGYAGAGHLFVSALAVIFGAAWMYSEWRGLTWFSMAGLGLTVFAAAVAIFLGVDIGWLFAGVTFSLIAWDLMEFRSRLKLTSSETDVPALERKHLLRLGLLAATATVLFAITVLAHWRLGLWPLILLAFVTGLGLFQVIWRFRSR